jgi:hypothetical protein
MAKRSAGRGTPYFKGATPEQRCSSMLHEISLAKVCKDIEAESASRMSFSGTIPILEVHDDIKDILAHNYH